MPDDIILEVDALPQINLEADGLADVSIGVDTIAKGDKGDDGDSAYQVAVNNGFVGTEAEWLASLVGNDYSDIISKPSINGVELSGNKTSAELGIVTTPDWNEDDSTALDYIQNRPNVRVGTDANGTSVIIGQINGTTTSASYSVSIGRSNTVTASAGVALGGDNTVSAQGAFASGRLNTASGSFASALGNKSTASGSSAFAEGYNTVSSSVASHAEGHTTQATAKQAHAEGYLTVASADASHAEGHSTQATAWEAHAEGYSTVASGGSSHAEGNNTIANHASQHVFGGYNIADPSENANTTRGNYVEIVGNGTADDARSNARTLDWSGNEVLAGTLTVGANPTANMEVATKQYVDSSVPDLTNYVTTDDSRLSDARTPTAHTHTTSDITDMPTKLSDFTDDLGSSPTHTHSQYAESSDLATVATSGSYTDLSDKPAIPTVPTNLSSFTDDLGSSPVHTHSQYLTSHQDLSAYAKTADLATVATSGDYADLANIPKLVKSVTATGGDGEVSVSTAYNDDSFVVSVAEINGYVSDASYSNRAFKIKRKNIVPDKTIFTADSSPTSGSGQLVTSGGVYTALASKADSSHTHTKSEITDFPTLATVATSGDYDDLSNKPTIPTVPTNLSSFTDDLGSSPTHTHSQYLTEHQSLSAYVKSSDLATVATSGDYDDLTNKPTIPAEVTETTVSNWGFTKNTGTYSKPSGGIPKSDLASAVQTSLGKADTALQSYTENDPVFTASVAHGITSADVTNWNNKGTYSKPSGGIPKSDLASAVQTSLGKADTALQSYTETDPVFTASVAHGITSTNITNWNSKQDAVSAGDGIDITSNVIANTQGIEYIRGTQTASTNAWTGVSTDSSLKTGKIIAYYLPYAGTSDPATLQLTMADGTTTSAIALRRTGSSTVTTHFAVNNVIIMVYDGTYWRVSAYYDANTNTIPTGYCTTGAGTVAKSATCTYGYRDDATYFPCVFRYANTASNATLAISSYAETALPIYVNGARTSSSNTFGRGVVMFLYYNSAYYCYNDGRFPIVVNGAVTSIQDQLALYTPTASLATVATSGAYSDLSGTPTNATTSTAGLMSATDKANLDAVYADYSSAITALGV